MKTVEEQFGKGVALCAKDQSQAQTTVARLLQIQSQESRFQNPHLLLKKKIFRGRSHSSLIGLARVEIGKGLRGVRSGLGAQRL